MSSYLTENDQPQLAGVASLLPQANGALVIHDTRSGQSFALSGVDAQVVRACNGKTTVATMVVTFGLRAQEVLGQLLSMGLILKDRPNVPGEVTITEQGSNEMGTITELPDGARELITSPQRPGVLPKVSSPSLPRVASRPTLDPVPSKSPPGVPAVAPVVPPEGRRQTLGVLPTSATPLKATPSIASGWEELPSKVTPAALDDYEPLTKRERPMAIVQGVPLAEPAAEEPERRADVRTWMPWAVLAIVVIGGTLYHRHTVNRLEAMIEQTAKPVATGPKTFSGHLAAKDPVNLDTPIAAPVKKVLVSRGQQVKKGALLIELEDAKVRAELAEAMTRAREATKQRMKLAGRVPAHATQADLDEATQRAEAAGAETRALQEQLEQYKVRAPADGVVIDLIVRAGDQAQGKNSAVAIFGDPNQLIAEVNVPPDFAKTLAPGAQAELTPEGGHAVPGTVLDVNAQSGLVRVQLGAHDAALKPAQAVSVTFGG
jgi:multidrug efflux pump subunit AcrA (membrane-fusion protein)